MEKILILLIFILTTVTVNAQENKTELLRDLEADQDYITTATLTSATRLFGSKNDLTSVIMVLPSGTEMELLDSDSTYLHVILEDYEGYIYKHHAVINERLLSDIAEPEAPEPEATEAEPEPEPVRQVQETQPAQEQQVSRFTYLENKYGSNMAARLMAGKIWKGMEAEMILDSWGNPRKINRVISGNVIKEEWIFRSTWLYLENDILTEWGPIRD
jgi:hypothetical protein